MLEASAGALKQTARRVTQGEDQRDQLAEDRTVLAVERTYAAWIRTGLTALAAGIGARALLAEILPAWVGLTTGFVLILFSVFCFVVALSRQLRPRHASPTTPPLPRLWLLLLTGFLALVALAASAAIWFVPEP